MRVLSGEKDENRNQKVETMTKSDGDFSDVLRLEFGAWILESFSIMRPHELQYSHTTKSSAHLPKEQLV